jgi:hypothetical protein
VLHTRTTKTTKRHHPLRRRGRARNGSHPADPYQETKDALIFMLFRKKKRSYDVSKKNWNVWNYKRRRGSKTTI